MAEHKSLTAALVAAQAEYPRVEKKSLNPHFKTNYADLADGMEVVRPVLTKNGIAHTQTFHVADGILLMRTSLLFGSEERQSELPIAQPANPQDFVKLTTYYRRVALFSMLGITPVGEDDDGESTRGVVNTQVPPRQTRQPPIKASGTNGHVNGNGHARSPAAAAVDAPVDSDQWKLHTLPIAEFIKTLVHCIDTRPWPEVDAAMQVYGPLARQILQPLEVDKVTKAYVVRKKLEANILSGG